MKHDIDRLISATLIILTFNHVYLGVNGKLHFGGYTNNWYWWVTAIKQFPILLVRVLSLGYY